ncbi:MAG: DNA gyrase subunit A [Holophagales bacterium]|nr:DNA gyrase subunit A [Holophagales bacterium]MYG30994.1 DNA gyrase subunit A [Holophagales bacterium]MYI80268.1 DNA gyrase subunit A [Holophagales bacterium]
MRRSYLDYAMSVIIGRALPDVRDGLKPVHRRVLYGMWEAGNTAGRAYKKSARIVGDVMGKYHPHGDGPIYDTVVRMAQDFSMRYPLVDGQGNFGSIDGDNPAAMRYTEVRLTRIAEELLREDIEKDTVEWVPNYDGSEQEPAPLPARIPNLLVNGSAGIAVGMATNIPPHNLGEAIAAVKLLIDRPQATLEELMELLPGPDFPTGGFIHGRAGIHDAYATGRGSIQVRARAEIEDAGQDSQSIIVTELPFQVNKARLIERIAELVREKKLEGIRDLRDESDRDGIRVVIDLKRGEMAEIVLNTLYKMTKLQVSYGMNMLAIVDSQPQVLTLRALLRHFLDHRRTVVIRRCRYDLARAEKRAHVLEGLLIALDHLDAVIATIRASRTPPEARERLIEGFTLSEPQAQAILDMRLQRLTGLEREKIEQEHRELIAEIERLRAILGSDALLLREIRTELDEIEKRFSDPRRTEIVAHSSDITIEDMIADEDMVITVTRSGYIKRSPLSLYRAQHRGGKGRTGMATRDGDFVEQLYVASAHSYIMVFTDRGYCYWLKVHQIPELGPAARGKAIVNLLRLDSGEGVAATAAVREFPEDRFLTFATEAGVVKKTALSEYSRPRNNGIIALRIDEDDRLLSVKVTDTGSELVLATQKGYAIRFRESDLRSLGRATRGVRGISLRPGDRVVSMECLLPREESVQAQAPETTLLTVSESGFGKRTAIEEYRLQSRGGLGIINLKVSDRTGDVVGVRQVSEDTGLMLITHEGKIIRITAGSVSLIGRATQGVKVMDLDDGDRIVALARIPDRGEEDEDGEEGDAEAAETEPVN